MGEATCLGIEKRDAAGFTRGCTWRGGMKAEAMLGLPTVQRARDGIGGGGETQPRSSE